MTTHALLLSVALAALALCAVLLLWAMARPAKLSPRRIAAPAIATAAAAAGLALHWGSFKLADSVFAEKFAGPVIHLAASSDGTFIAAADTTGTLRTHNLETGADFGPQTIDGLVSLDFQRLFAKPADSDRIMGLKSDGSSFDSDPALAESGKALVSTKQKSVLHLLQKDELFTVNEITNDKTGAISFEAGIANAREFVTTGETLTVRPTAVAAISAPGNNGRYALGLADGRLAMIDFSRTFNEWVRLSAPTGRESGPVTLLAAEGRYIVGVNARGNVQSWLLNEAGGTPQAIAGLIGPLPVVKVKLPTGSPVYAMSPGRDLLLADIGSAPTRLLPNTGVVLDLRGQRVAVLSGHRGSINSAEFNGNGTFIVTASGDGTARLWNVDGNLLKVFEHKSAVNSAAFSPSGTMVVTASDDNKARIWQLSGTEPIELNGHFARVNSARFSPDGTRIVTASDDRTVALWDTSGRKLLQLSDFPDAVSSAFFSSDGKYIVATSLDGSIRVWTLAGEKVAAIREENKFFSGARFTDGDTAIIAMTSTGEIMRWRLSDQALISVLPNFASNESTGALITPDGLTAVGSNVQGDTASIWNLAHIGNASCLGCAAVTIDPKTFEITLVDYLGRRQVYDGLTGLRKGETPGPVTGHGHPLGARALLEANDDGSLAWSDSTSRTALMASSSTITSALQLPDGRILTGSADGDVRILDRSMHGTMNAIDIWPRLAALASWFLPQAEAPAPVERPAAFAAALAFTLIQERGAPQTQMPANAGISQAAYDTYRASKSLTSQMVGKISETEISDIYFENYWLKAGCDTLSPLLARVHFDAAVNHGILRASGYLTLVRQMAKTGPVDEPTLVAEYLDRRKLFIESRKLGANIRNALLRRLDALARDVGVSWTATPPAALN